MQRRLIASRGRAALIVLAFLCLSGFSVQKNAAVLSQPADERKAQDTLPQSKDPVWDSFHQCKVHYNDTKHTYSIDYSPAVKAIEGKPLTVNGFILPLESTEKFKHFLLSKRTPTCPFCPPGEPNEIVEVFLTKPIKYSEGIIAVTGTLKFTTNPDLGLFFQLTDANSMDYKPEKPKHSIPLV